MSTNLMHRYVRPVARQSCSCQLIALLRGLRTGLLNTDIFAQKPVILNLSLSRIRIRIRILGSNPQISDVLANVSIIRFIMSRLFLSNGYSNPRLTRERCHTAIILSVAALWAFAIRNGVRRGHWRLRSDRYALTEKHRSQYRSATD
jgi:hypothetical protein